MKHLKNYNFFISELFTHNTNSEINDKHFILYKKDLWIFDESEWGENEIWNTINDIIGEEILEEDLYDSITTLKEEHPYILLGEINDDKIIIDGSLNYRHSSLSTDLKKLKQELNLPIDIRSSKGVYNGDESYNKEVDFSELKDAWFYHGTSLKHIDKISKIGISPIKGKTNFKNIQHNNNIFITTNIEKAFFHAKTSALNENSYPIILKFKVSDTNKLIMDYDVGIDFYGIDNETNNKLGYSGIATKNNLHKIDTSTIDSSKDIDLSRKFGIYGYLGRIPSNMINTVFIDLYALQDNWDLFDDEFSYDEINHESEIWNEIDDISQWSEVDIKDVSNRVDEIEDNWRDEMGYNDEDEDED